MLQQPHQCKTSTIAQIPGTKQYFINALSDSSTTSIALGITLAHTRTGEEVFIDLIAEDDRLWRVLAIIREHFNSYWSLFETFEIEPLSVIEHPESERMAA